MKKQLTQLLILFVLSLSTAYGQGLPFPLTNNNYEDNSAYIEGEYIYWLAKGEVNRIYQHHIPTNIRKQLEMPTEEFHVSGDYILLEEYPTSLNRKLQLYHIPSKTTTDIMIDSEFEDLLLNEQYATWQIDGEVHTYHLESGEKRIYSSENYWEPDIWENYLTWRDSDGRVFLLNMDTENIQQLSNEGLSASNPKIHSNRVVWDEILGNDFNSLEVWFYDILTDETHNLTDNDVADYRQQIYGDYVVWQSLDYDTWVNDRKKSLYFYHIPSGTTTMFAAPRRNQDSPLLYKDMIIWTYREEGALKQTAFTRIGGNLTHTITELDGRILDFTDEHMVYLNWSSQQAMSSYEIVLFDLNDFPTSLPAIREETAIHLYPNPTKNWLNIEWKNSNELKENTALKVFDVQGKLVFQQKIETPYLQISTEDWNKGIYFLQLSNGEQSWVEKGWKE